MDDGTATQGKVDQNTNEPEAIRRAAVEQLTTAQLYTLARSLRSQIEEATGSVRFTTPVAEIPNDEYHDQVQDWSG